MKIILLALLTLSFQTQAQIVDLNDSIGEDFVQGDSGPSENSHSEFVPGLQLGQPKAIGEGCPEGSYSATLTPDQKTLSVLFSEYVSEAGSTTGLPRAVKRCNLIVPVTVPEGFQASVVKIDYRGFVEVPDQASARFVSSHRFKQQASGLPDDVGEVQKTIFNGPLSQEFMVSSQLRNGRRWSRCGKDVSLRLNSKAVAISNKKMEQSIIALDSLDTKTLDAKYHFLWRKCKSPTPAPGPIACQVPRDQEAACQRENNSWHRAWWAPCNSCTPGDSCRKPAGRSQCGQCFTKETCR